MPNSRFALHGKRPSLIHGLCAIFASNSRCMRLFQAALDTCLDSPFIASLSVHVLHFTVCSRTLSGLFLVGALNRPRKRKRTNREKSPDHPRANRENPRKIGKVPKRTKKEGQVQIGKPPRLKPPRLAALDKSGAFLFLPCSHIKMPLLKGVGNW